MNKIGVLVILILAIGIILGINIFLRNKESKKRQIVQAEEKTSTTAVKDLSITVSYDNNSYKGGLTTAWGFSCVIRGTEKTILFDTGGDGSILLTNMKELGINPKENRIGCAFSYPWRPCGRIAQLSGKKSRSCGLSA